MSILQLGVNIVVSSKFFHEICNFIFTILLIMVSYQLISLVFFTSSVVQTLSSDYTKPAISEEQVTFVSVDLDEYLSKYKILNKPVYDKWTVYERRQNNLNTALPSLQHYYGEKVVYLTFDDGPDSENTPMVLDILNRNEVKATFFITGNQAEKNPELLNRIYSEGHAIGNHSYNHVYRDLYKSTSSYLEQLHRTDEIIKNIIGVRPRISRAPGGSAGSFTKQYWDAIRQEGYIEVGWNVSSGDASHAKAEQIFNNISHQMDNKFLWSHAIILMHDGRGHDETVKALPNIIKYFKDRNFEFRVVSLETPPPW